MDDNNLTLTEPAEMWATVELMGHGQTAGRISMPTEWGGLLRVDVPNADGSYTTEFYGLRAVYRIKFTSEQIARAYAPQERDIMAYDAPIVTREQHEAAIRDQRTEINLLRRQVNQLQNRLTAVSSLPETGDDEADIDF